MAIGVSTISGGGPERRSSTARDCESPREFGVIGEVWSRLSQIYGFDWLQVNRQGKQTVLVDTRSEAFLNRHARCAKPWEPIPVRLGKWEREQDLLALILGDKQDRWLAVRKTEKAYQLVSADWELDRGGIGRFYFDQPMPRFQILAGNPAQVLLEAVRTPNGDLDFVSPAGLFKEAVQVSFLQKDLTRETSGFVAKIGGDCQIMGLGSRAFTRQLGPEGKRKISLSIGCNSTGAADLWFILYSGDAQKSEPDFNDAELYVSVSLKPEDFLPRRILSNLFAYRGYLADMALVRGELKNG